MIIGGGSASSATALHLLRSGVQPLIIERESFPRFHIGESLRGECGAGLRTLDMEPEIRCQNYPIKTRRQLIQPDRRTIFAGGEEALAED